MCQAAGTQSDIWDKLYGVQYGRLARVATLGLLGFMLGACSADERVDPARPTTSTSFGPTSTETTAQDPADAVLEAYRAGWSAYIEFGGSTLIAPPAAGSPATTLPYPSRFEAAMSPHFAGDQYQRLFDFFQLQSIKREELRGTIDLRPKVLSISAESAVVEDCYDDRDLGSYKAGAYPPERTDPVSEARTRATAELRFEDGRWKTVKVTPMGSGCEP